MPIDVGAMEDRLVATQPIALSAAAAPAAAPPANSISGSVFRDLNGDGLRQSFEPGVPGMTLFLDTNRDGSASPYTISYSYGGSSAHIGCSDTPTPEITVSGALARIADVDVWVDIRHDRDTDLDISLRSPLGTTIDLSSDNGAGSGDIYSNRIFDDEAPGPIWNATPPFFDRYYPDQPLSNFDGQNPNGTWQLTVNDDSCNSSGGTFYDWDLTLTFNETAVTTDGDGNYTFANVIPGTNRVRAITPTAWLATGATAGYRDATLLSGYSVEGLNFGIRPSDVPLLAPDGLEPAANLPGGAFQFQCAPFCEGNWYDTDFSIHFPGDVDWFRLDTTGPGQWTNWVEIEFDDRLGDLDVELYDEAVLSDLNHWPLRRSEPTSYGKRINLIGLAEGRYYAKVVGMAGVVNPSYDLSVNHPGRDWLDGYQPNSTPQEATNIGRWCGDESGYLTGKVQCGNLSIDSTVDEDWFRFQTAAEGGIGHYMSLDFDGTQGDMNLELYDASGSPIEISEGFGDGEYISLNKQPAGVYYARVYGLDGDVNPQYEIEVYAPYGTTGDWLDLRDGGNETTLTASDLGIVEGYFNYVDLSIHQGDADGFRIETTADAVDGHFLRIDYDGTQGDLELILWDSLGNPLGAFPGTSSTAQLSLRGWPRGVYFVSVRGVSVDGQRVTNDDYSLTVVAPKAPAPDWAEPNNNAPRDLGTVHGERVWDDLSLHYDGDDDRFRFRLAQRAMSDHWVYVNVDDVGQPIEMELYDAQGRMVGRSSSQRYFEGIQLAGLAAGDYELRVSGKNPYYWLTIVAPPALLADQYDTLGSTPNDAFAARTDLGLLEGERTWNDLSLHTIEDADVFGFQLDATGVAGQFVRVDLDHEHGDVDLWLFKYDNELGQWRLLRKSNSQTDREEVSLAGLEPGEEYALLVDGKYVGGMNPDYSLTINAPRGSKPDWTEADLRYDLGPVIGEQVWSNLSIHSPSDEECARFGNAAGCADDDVFRFELLQPGSTGHFVRVNFLHGLGDLDAVLLQCDGLDPNQWPLVGASDSVTDNEHISLADWGAGKYCLIVEGYAGAMNPSYSVTVSAPAGKTDDEFLEANDELLLATSLGPLEGFDTLGLEPSGRLSIHAGGDEDWFRFSITEAAAAGHYARINFDQLGGDLNLELRDASGHVVQASTGAVNQEQVSFAGLNAGADYFLRVYGAAVAANTKYSIEFNAPGWDWSEEGKPSSGATAYDLGEIPGFSTRDHLSIDTTDEDWFTFTLSADQVEGNYAGISFLQAQGNLDVDVFTDPAGQPLALPQSGGDGKRISLAGLPARDANSDPINYYLRVRGAETGAAGRARNAAYSLSLYTSRPLVPDFTESHGPGPYVLDDWVVGSWRLGDHYLNNQWLGLSIDSPTDVDWFQFETTDKGVPAHFVSLAFNSFAGDLDLELWDQSGLVRHARTSGNIETISLHGLDAGVYRVKVSGHNGATNPEYVLSINAPGHIYTDWSEVNNDQPAAKNLRTVEGTRRFDDLSINEASDVDWFRFQIAGAPIAGNLVAIDYDPDYGHLYLELYDAAGQTRLAQAGGFTGHSQIVLPGRVEPGVTYLVKVAARSEQGRHPRYALTFVAPQSQGDRTEGTAEGDRNADSGPGDTAARAHDLEKLRGVQTVDDLSIHATGDEDWFKFTLSAPAVAGHWLALSSDFQSGDLDFELYDSPAAGLPIREAVGGAGSTDLERLDLGGLAAGATYYLRVFGYRGATNPAYQLLVNAPLDYAQAGDAWEATGGPTGNNSRQTATRLQTVEGVATATGLSIDSASDQDWFAFQLPRTAARGHYVAIDFDHDEGNLDIDLRDQNGNPVFGASTGMSDREQISLAGLAATPAGNPSNYYFLRVYGAPNPNYTLTFNAPVTAQADRFDRHGQSNDAVVFGAGLLAPNDPIVAIDLDPLTSASASPLGEEAWRAVDWLNDTKYLNFGEEHSGLIVTPANPIAAVQSFRLRTAGDHPERDPASWQLYGTTDAITSPDHSMGVDEKWTLIGEGLLACSTARSTQCPVVYVPNEVEYGSYKLIFPTVRDAATANSMQFAEVQFFSTVDGTGWGLLTPADMVRAIDLSPSSRSPDTEGPANAVDANSQTKYLNFGELNSGFIVTPTIGRQTIVTSFVITTANDAIERDPTAWSLYGTNDAITSPNHSQGAHERWTLIDSGVVALPINRRAVGPTVTVDNVTPYSSYRMVFTGVRDSALADSVQFGDIQFRGAAIRSATDLREVSGTLLVGELSLHSAADLDWFRFETVADAVAGHSVRIEFNGQEGTPTLELYDAGGRPIGEPLAAYADYQEISLAGLAAGTYFVKVAGAANPDYRFVIRAPSLPRPDVAEGKIGNNEPATAYDLRSVAAAGGRVYENVLPGFNASSGYPICAQTFLNSCVQPRFDPSSPTPNYGISDPRIAGFGNGYGGTFTEAEQNNALNGVVPWMFQTDAFAHEQLIADISEAARSGITLDQLNQQRAAATFQQTQQQINASNAAIAEITARDRLFKTFMVLAIKRLFGRAEDASGLPMNTLGGLSIDLPTDVDWYEFNLPDDGLPGQSVRILFDNDQGDLQLKLYPMAALGSSEKPECNADIESIEVANTQADFEELSLARLRRGDYFLCVSGVDGVTNPQYRLQFTLAPPADVPQPDWAEANDTSIEATDLRRLEGLRVLDGLSIHSTTDEDWFHFELPTAANEDSAIALLFQHAQGDLDVELYRKAFVPGGPVFATLIHRVDGTTNLERIALKDAHGSPLPAGGYFLRVSGYDGATNPNYSLIFNLPESTLGADRLEGNNTPPEATNLNNLSGASQVDGLTITPGDSDWFRFRTTGPGGAVTIKFDGAAGDLQLALYSDGITSAPVLSSLGVGSTETITIPNWWPADEYYVRVYGETTDTTGRYDLRIDAPTTPAATVVDWTIMVYMSAGELAEYAFEDINEMEEAATRLPGSAKIVVLYDQPSHPSLIASQKSTGNGLQVAWGDTRLGVIRPDTNRDEIATDFPLLRGERNTALSDTLQGFITDAAALAPANNYALILWNHGGGIRGTNYDRFDPNQPNPEDTVLSIREIADALAATPTEIRPKLIGFDACYMGMAEIASMLAPHTADGAVIVGSQEVESFGGFDYTTALGALIGHPGPVTTEALATGMVASFQRKYQDDPQGANTLSATLTHRYGAVEEALSWFSLHSTWAMSSGLESEALHAILREARNATPSSSGQSDFRDLGRFMKEVADRTAGRGEFQLVHNAARNVVAALQNAVLAKTADLAGATGLSIYLPAPGGSVDSIYDSVGDFGPFFNNTLWDSFVEQFVACDECTPAATSDWSEPNDIALRAYNLHELTGGGHVLSGLTLHNPDDADWFRFRTLAEGRVAVNANFPAGQATLRLSLFDATDITLLATMQSDSGRLVVSFVTAAVGEYLLLVESDETAAASPQYSLVIDAPTAEIDVADWASGNNTPNKAHPLGTIRDATVWTGLRTIASQPDWFIFETPRTVSDEPCTVGAITVHLAMDAAAMLRVYDLAQDSGADDPLAEQSGRRAIRAFYSSTAGNSYRFSVQSMDGEPLSYSIEFDHAVAGACSRLAYSSFDEPPLGSASYSATLGSSELGFVTISEPAGEAPFVGVIDTSTTPTSPVLAHRSVRATTTFDTVNLENVTAVTVNVAMQVRNTTYESGDYVRMYVTNGSKYVDLIQAQGSDLLDPLDEIAGRGYVTYSAEIPDDWTQATLVLESATNSTVGAERFDFDSVEFRGAPLPRLAGDLNRDGRVGLLDLALLQRNYGLTAESAESTATDLNGDAMVNREDLAAFVSNFGRVSSAPANTSATPAASSVIQQVPVGVTRRSNTANSSEKPPAVGRLVAERNTRRTVRAIDEAMADLARPVNQGEMTILAAQRTTRSLRQR
jgi:subtilisin-like proprotein convertase family protein